MSDAEALRRAAARLAAGRVGCDGEAVETTATSGGALLAFAGDVVVKVHRAGTSGSMLANRLRLALRWSDCLLAPLAPDPVPLRTAGHGAGLVRWATLWPRVSTVPADPDAAPWAEAGELLARLHRRAAPALGLPPHGAVDRLRRSLAALESTASATPTATAPEPALQGQPELLPAPESGSGSEPEPGHPLLDAGPAAALGQAAVAAVAAVRQAAGALPAQAWEPAAPGRSIRVVHGDWHLGQLGHVPSGAAGSARGGESGRPSEQPAPDAGPGWRLIDPDDVGLGDPAWDFARPAALRAAGVLPDHEWRVLVDAYRAAGGPALPPPPAAPWPPLDAVARAGVVQAAAVAVRRAIEEHRGLDIVDRALVAACRSLARTAG